MVVQSTPEANSMGISWQAPPCGKTSLPVKIIHHWIPCFQLVNCSFSVCTSYWLVRPCVWQTNSLDPFCSIRLGNETIFICPNDVDPTWRQTCEWDMGSREQYVSAKSHGARIHGAPMFAPPPPTHLHHGTWISGPVDGPYPTSTKQIKPHENWLASHQFQPVRSGFRPSTVSTPNLQMGWSRACTAACYLSAMVQWEGCMPLRCVIALLGK